MTLDQLSLEIGNLRGKYGSEEVRLIVGGTSHPIVQVWTETPSPCGYSEPESDYRDPIGAHRTARCEGGRLVVRGTGEDSVTDGKMFLSSRPCPRCRPTVICIGDDPR